MNHSYESPSTPPETPIELIPAMVQRAKAAQQSWASLSPSARAEILLNAREYILDHKDRIAEVIHSENGKPITEALVHDILPVLELITHYSAKAEDLLRPKRIPLRMMKHRSSSLHYWPVGVVAVVAPWNFPFSIPFGETVLALLAGNAVILKPSEVTPRIGLKIGEILEQAGLPKDVFQIITGGGAHGAALVSSKVNKIFFTGSVSTGKKVMAAAAMNLTPVILELGGKDPMIVLADANLDYATSAALWGGFANSGQVCASVERILVHESIHDDFVSLLRKKLDQLVSLDQRTVEPSVNRDHLQNFGTITFSGQRRVYEDHLAELSPFNSKIVCGGSFHPSQNKLLPTIITNPPSSPSQPLERTKIYQEETFGPVVAISTFKTPQEAVEKANDSPYGLLASVFGTDRYAAEQVASQIEAGTVLINEVLYTHGISETPWGGVKNSGFGRVHSDEGFYEFLNVRHIHKEAVPGLIFKNPWWFPYTPHQLQMFKAFCETLYRRHWFSRLRALPQLLIEFVEMLKWEKRL